MQYRLDNMIFVGVALITDWINQKYPSVWRVFLFVVIWYQKFVKRILKSTKTREKLILVVGFFYVPFLVTKKLP